MWDVKKRGNLLAWQWKLNRERAQLDLIQLNINACNFQCCDILCCASNLVDDIGKQGTLTHTFIIEQITVCSDGNKSPGWHNSSKTSFLASPMTSIKVFATVTCTVPGVNVSLGGGWDLRGSENRLNIYFPNEFCFTTYLNDLWTLSARYSFKKSRMLSIVRLTFAGMIKWCPYTGFS